MSNKIPDSVTTLTVSIQFTNATGYAGVARLLCTDTGGWDGGAGTFRTDGEGVLIYFGSDKEDLFEIQILLIRHRTFPLSSDFVVQFYV